MRIRYGRTCAVVLAVSVLALPVEAQRSARGGDAQSRVEQRRELERARRALEAASESLEDALDRLGRAGDDTAARTAARAALNEASRAVARAQAMYAIQQQRAAEADVRRAMRAQVERAQRAARAAASQAATMQRASQQGWIGIFLSDSEAPGSGGTRGYPKIVSVEPGSPADHAGLEAGDVLVSIDGRRLGTGSTSITRLLHPGARIPVRIRRGDDTRELHVRVGRRPGAYAYSFEVGSGGSGGVSPEAIVTAIPPMPPVHGAPTPRPARPSRASVPAAPTPMPGVVVSAASPSGAFGTFYFNGVSTIAGAQLWRVDDLEDYFHVDSGLLVLRVLPGTPADRAGLRSGDVIVRAGGRPVTSIRTLQWALERAEDHPDGHAVPVNAVRRGKPLRVTLRW